MDNFWFMSACSTGRPSYSGHGPSQTLKGYMGVSQNSGYLGVPYNKDYSILGPILGSPYLGKLPYRSYTYIGCRV